MMEEFKNLLLKRKKEQEKNPVDPRKLEAKKNVMKELSDLLSEDIGKDLDSSMKKVTIASDSKEGLQEGLDKAKDILEKKPLEEDESEEKEESMEHESSEESSEDDVELKIAELEKKLEELKAKKS